MAETTPGGADKPAKRRPGKPFGKGKDNPRNYAPTRSGMQPGGKHKATIVRDAVLGAFVNVGGQQYLETVARSKKYRPHFLALLGKAMPAEVTGAGGGPIEMHVLHIATAGLERLTDVELQQFHGLLVKIGVNDIVPASNDAESIPLLPAKVGASS